MEYCAKRWQTKEGTYQLKRRRLLPDVRDPPEQGDAAVDMKDIWSLHGWHGWLLHGGRDAMRGWEGRDLFHLFCEFSLAVLVGVGLFCVCLFVYFFWALPLKILHSISVSHLWQISSSWPTMSRASSAMQEKTKIFGHMRISGWAPSPLPWDWAIWIARARCRPFPQHYIKSGGRWHLEEGHKVHERSTTWSADRSAVLAMNWEGTTDLLTAQDHSEHSSRVSHANTQGEWCLCSRALVPGSSTLPQSTIDVTSNGRQHRSRPPVRVTLRHLQAVHRDTACLSAYWNSMGSTGVSRGMGKRHILLHHLWRAWPYREWWQTTYLSQGGLDGQTWASRALDSRHCGWNRHTDLSTH